jgi:hypothetical protein
MISIILGMIKRENCCADASILGVEPGINH